MSRPKLLFVYDHANPQWWMDGLSRALDLLEEDFEVVRLNLREEGHWPADSFDFYLGWGAAGSEADKYLQKYPEKITGLCVAGMNDGDFSHYNVLFIETDYQLERVDHPNKVKAFGCNVDIFFPSPVGTPVVWDYIGVGAFAEWKRWEKMTEKKGNKLVVGHYQRDNESESMNIVRDLMRGGVMTSPEVDPMTLANLYHWSRTAYIPADIYGGGERAVLEAAACGLDVEVEYDNPKLKGLLDREVPTHEDYAQVLKDEIMSVL